LKLLCCRACRGLGRRVLVVAFIRIAWLSLLAEQSPLQP
jgi:hypothetical protein